MRWRIPQRLVYAQMQILVVHILVNLKRFFGHNSAPGYQIGLKMDGTLKYLENNDLPPPPPNLQKTT